MHLSLYDPSPVVEISERDCIYSSPPRTVFGTPSLRLLCRATLIPCRTSECDTIARLSSTPLIGDFHASLLQDDISNQVPAPCHERKTITGGVVDELMARRECGFKHASRLDPASDRPTATRELDGAAVQWMPTGHGRCMPVRLRQLGLRPNQYSLTDVEMHSNAPRGRRPAGVRDGME